MAIQIRLNEIFIKELNFKCEVFDKNITNDINANFEFVPIFNNEKPFEFEIQFNIKLSDKSRIFNLQLVSSALFLTDNPISDEFKNSIFVNVSSPAIAFPYLRTFISNYTLNAGFNSLILPSYNFVKIYEESIKDDVQKK